MLGKLACRLAYLKWAYEDFWIVFYVLCVEYRIVYRNCVLGFLSYYVLICSGRKEIL